MHVVGERYSANNVMEGVVYSYSLLECPRLYQAFATRNKIFIAMISNQFQDQKKSRTSTDAVPSVSAPFARNHLFSQQQDEEI